MTQGSEGEEVLFLSSISSLLLSQFATRSMNFRDMSLVSCDKMSFARIQNLPLWLWPGFFFREHKLCKSRRFHSLFFLFFPFSSSTRCSQGGFLVIYDGKDQPIGGGERGRGTFCCCSCSFNNQVRSK